MAGKEAYAAWLLESKKRITKSKDWKSFTEQLNDVVDSHLEENGIASLEDLSDSERILFLDNAIRNLHSDSCYDDLYSRVSLTLDQQVNNAVAKELLTMDPGHTKTELVLDHLRDGAVSILKRWPDMKSKLHMCLNMPLPTKLRSVAWTLFLSNSQVRKEYIDSLLNPRKAISVNDEKISKICEQILKIQNTFPDIAAPNVGAFYAMKAVLSHFHAKQNTKHELNNVYYLLILPMLHIMAPYLSKNKPATNNAVAVLVEMYLTLFRDLPPYVADVNDENEREGRAFVEKVAEHLLGFDAHNDDSLSEFIINTSLEQKLRGDTEKSILTRMLADVLQPLVKPLIKSMFVGFLNKDLLMFVWDQYIIGLDVAGYHWHFLPAFTASLFYLLRHDIRRCKSGAEIAATIQKEVRKVNLHQMQHTIQNYHFKDLYSELNQDDKAAVPAIDPTRGLGRRLDLSLEDMEDFYAWKQERYKNGVADSSIWPTAASDATFQRATANGFASSWYNPETAAGFTRMGTHTQVPDSSVVGPGRISPTDTAAFYQWKYLMLSPEELAEFNEWKKTRTRRQEIGDSVGESHHWKHWGNELIPRRTGPYERQIARDARQAERERLLRLRQDEELRRRDEVAYKQRLLEEKLREATLREHELERMRLQELLDQERQQRLERDRLYEDELEKMKIEIEMLKRQRRPPSVISKHSAKAPPPSRASIFPPVRQAPMPIPEPKPKTAADEPSVEDILHDLVTVIANNYNNLSHGEGEDRRELNASTREEIDEHKVDVKLAEAEVFGKQLKPGEFEKLAADVQAEKSDEMMDVIRRRLEDRREENLKKGPANGGLRM